jgi:AcrR family transcriptional regulator
MARPRASSGPDSRARILAAATAEFAAHGFSGASVDRIARKARLTKAMLYYHFDSKDALYRDILQGTFAAVGRRVGAVAHADLPPDAKLSAFVDAFVEEVGRRPAFPRMVMRELAESGRHLDADTVRALLAVPRAFLDILAEGVAAGAFRDVHPLLGYFAVIGPVVLSHASIPMRRRLQSLTGQSLPDIDRGDLAAEARALALAVFSLPPRQPTNGVRHGSRQTPSLVDHQPRPRRRARLRVP